MRAPWATARRNGLLTLGGLAVMVTVAHVVIEAAVTASWEWGLVAIDAGTALLVVGIALIYLRDAERTRRREVIEQVLIELLSTPRSIRDTADEALRSVTEHGIAATGVVGMIDDADQPLRPLAARGSFPRGWLSRAPAVSLDAVGSAPTIERGDHPWLSGSEASADRGWVTQLPIASDGEVLGLVVLGSHDRGELGDENIRELLASRLSAAFNHAALYEAAYERERTLEDLETRRREFMAAIAHEIRTPLTSIQAFADLLQMGQAEMDETARALVTSLNHGVQRLSTIVNDLIDLGRSGDVSYAMVNVDVDLGQVIRDAEATLRPALVLRNQAITLNLPPEGPVVQSDPRLVEQVVVNLLSNANRHSPDHGKIVVTASQLDHTTVRLEVSDDGRGIPKAERLRIFEPYYRVQGSEVPGSGLGLAVAKRLLEEHGGRIWADESESGGAAFHVELRSAHP